MVFETTEEVENRRQGTGPRVYNKIYFLGVNGTPFHIEYFVVE